VRNFLAGNTKTRSLPHTTAARPNSTRFHTMSHPAIDPRAPYPQLQLPRSPLPLCTNRASGATASAHLHKSSEARCVQCNKMPKTQIQCPNAGPKDVHNNRAGTTHTRRVHHWCHRVQCLGNDIRSLATHLQKNASCTRYFSITLTKPIAKSLGCVDTAMRTTRPILTGFFLVILLYSIAQLLTLTFVVILVYSISQLFTLNFFLILGSSTSTVFTTT